MEILQKLLIDLEKSVQCAICLDSLKSPMTTRCDHNFCEYCIKQALKGKVDIPCPLCKKIIRQRSLKKAAYLRKIIPSVHKITNTIQEDGDIPYTLSQSTRSIVKANMLNQIPESNGKASETMSSVIMSSAIVDDQENGPLTKRIRLSRSVLPSDTQDEQFANEILPQTPPDLILTCGDKSMQDKNDNETEEVDHLPSNPNQEWNQEENTEESAMQSTATTTTNVASKFVVAADVHLPPKTISNNLSRNVLSNTENRDDPTSLPVMSPTKNSDLSIAFSQALVNEAALTPNSSQEYSEHFSENIIEDPFDFPSNPSKKKATKPKKTSKSHKEPKSKQSERKVTRQSTKMNKNETASKEKVLSEAAVPAETREVEELKAKLSEVENHNLTIEKTSQAVKPVAKKSGTTKIATSTDVAKKRKNSGGNKDGTTRRNKDSEIQAVKESPQIARRLLSTSSSSTDSDLKAQDKNKLLCPSVSSNQQSVTDKVTNWLAQSKVDSRVSLPSSSNDGMDSVCSPSSLKSSQMSEDDLISHSQISEEQLSNRVIVLKRRRKFISPVKLDPKIQESVKNQLWARDSAVFGPRKPRKSYLAKRSPAFAGLTLQSKMKASHDDTSLSKSLSADEVKNIDDDLPEIVSKSRQKYQRKKRDSKDSTAIEKSLFDEIGSDEVNTNSADSKLIYDTVDPLKAIVDEISIHNALHEGELTIEKFSNPAGRHSDTNELNVKFNRKAALKENMLHSITTRNHNHDQSQEAGEVSANNIPDGEKRATENTTETENSDCRGVLPVPKVVIKVSRKGKNIKKAVSGKTVTMKNSSSKPIPSISRTSRSKLRNDPDRVGHKANLPKVGASPGAMPETSNMVEETEAQTSVELHLLEFSEPTQLFTDQTGARPVADADPKNLSDVVVETCREVLEEWTKSSITNQTTEKKNTLEPGVDEMNNKDASVSANTVTSNSAIPPSTMTDCGMLPIPSPGNLLNWHSASELTPESPDNYLTPVVTDTNATKFGSGPLPHSHGQEFLGDSEIHTSVDVRQKFELEPGKKKNRPTSKRRKKSEEEKTTSSCTSDVGSLHCVSNGWGGTKLRIFRSGPTKDDGSSTSKELLDHSASDENNEDDVIVSSQQGSLAMLTAVDSNLDEDNAPLPEHPRKQGTAEEISPTNSNDFVLVSNSADIGLQKLPVRKSQRLSFKTDRYCAWKLKDNSNNIVLEHIERAMEQANAESEPIVWSGFSKIGQGARPINRRYKKKMDTSFALNKTLQIKFKRAAKSRLNRVTKLKGKKNYPPSTKIRKRRRDPDDELIPSTWPLANKSSPSQSSFTLDQSQPASVPKHFTDVSVVLQRLDKSDLSDQTSNKTSTFHEAENFSIPSSPLLFATQEEDCSRDSTNAHTSSGLRNSITAVYNRDQKSIQIDLRHLKSLSATPVVDIVTSKMTDDNKIEKTDHRAYDETDVICCSWNDNEKEKFYTSEQSCHEEDSTLDTNEESTTENVVVRNGVEQDFMKILENLSKIDTASLYQQFPKNTSQIRKLLGLAKKVHSSLTNITSKPSTRDSVGRLSSEQIEKTTDQTKITLRDISQVSTVNETNSCSAEFSGGKTHVNGTHNANLGADHTINSLTLDNATTETNNSKTTLWVKKNVGSPLKTPEQGSSNPVTNMGLENKQKKPRTARKTIGRRIKKSVESKLVEIRKKKPSRGEEKENSEKNDNLTETQSFQNSLHNACIENTYEFQDTITENKMLVACTEEGNNDGAAEIIVENNNVKLRSLSEFPSGGSEERDISNKNNCKTNTPIKVLKASLCIDEVRETLSPWLSNQSAGMKTGASTQKSGKRLKKLTIDDPKSSDSQQTSRDQPNTEENSLSHPSDPEKTSSGSKKSVDKCSTTDKNIAPQKGQLTSDNDMQVLSATEVKCSSPAPVPLPENDPIVISRRMAVAPKVHRWFSTHSDGMSPKRSKEIGLIATGLAEKEIRYVKAFAKRYGAQYYSTFDSKKVTHVVVKTSKQLSCDRTLKYLQGIASKKWVVSLKWIYSCLSNGSLISEEDFEVLGDNCMGEVHSQEAFLQNGPKKSRTSDFKHLVNYRCVCLPPFNFITVEQASELLKLCGATVTDNLGGLIGCEGLSKKDNAKQVNINLIIVDADATSETPNFSGLSLDYRATVVSIEWVYESISRFEAQPIEDYNITGNTQEEMVSL